MVLGGVIMDAENKISVFVCCKLCALLQRRLRILRARQIDFHIVILAKRLVHCLCRDQVHLFLQMIVVRGTEILAAVSRIDDDDRNLPDRLDPIHSPGLHGQTNEGKKNQNR